MVTIHPKVMFEHTFFMFLHTIQKYNTIRMIDELMRYAIDQPPLREFHPSKLRGMFHAILGLLPQHHHSNQLQTHVSLL
jgi:hypothetical protein